MSNRQWRSAVVGMGVIGDHHVRAISQISEAQLVAVCDPVEDKARQRLAKLNLSHVPLYADQREMMRKESIDVVHVCTPSGDHLNPSLIAIESGASVICEKPLEITLDRIDRMAEAAEKHRVRLAGILQRRWDRALRAIKGALVEGRFGTLAWGGAFTPWYRSEAYFAAAGWRGTWKYDGGGAAMNQSIHAIDLLQWYLGPVAQVCALAGSRIHPKIEVEDTLTCALQFASGAYGSIMGSTAMYPGGPVRVEIGGEKGTAVWEGGMRKFAFLEARPEDEQMLLAGAQTDRSKASAAEEGELDEHGQNIRSILQAWSNGKDAETSAAEARKAVAIILAMYESARRNGQPVEVASG